MEVKEAIELIDKMDGWLNNWQDDADSSSLSMDTLYIIDNIIKIKALLQQLDKYQQMWEELKNRNDDFFPNYGVRADNKIRMNCIEQKYFPKEIIDKVIEGIIEQIKEGAEISRKETKSDGS